MPNKQVFLVMTNKDKFRFSGSSWTERISQNLYREFYDLLVERNLYRRNWKFKHPQIAMNLEKSDLSL